MNAAGKPHRDTLGRYVFLLPYALLFLPFLVWPIVDGLRISLMRYELVSPTPPRFVGLGNFTEALNDPYFRKALWITIKFVVLTTPATVLAALGLALALHRIPARRRAVYRTLLFVPCLLTVTVVALVWRWLYNGEFGPINQLLAPLGVSPPWLTEPGWALVSIMLLTVWWTVGGPMVVLMAGLGEIPEACHEAAAMDGAGPLRMLWSVTLPLLKPALLFVVVLNLIASFQVFGQTFLVTHGGPELSTRVAVHYIFETAFQGYRLGYGSAMSWLLFLLIAVFSVFQARLMRR
jgi:multiple sugar transport system permease protein